MYTTTAHEYVVVSLANQAEQSVKILINGGFGIPVGENLYRVRYEVARQLRLKF